MWREHFVAQLSYTSRAHSTGRYQEEKEGDRIHLPQFNRVPLVIFLKSLYATTKVEAGKTGRATGAILKAVYRLSWS